MIPTTINRVPVDSASLASIGYAAEEGILEVEFRSGDIYRFFLVPLAVWHELLASDSKGAYFNHHVRNSYPHSTVANEAEDTLTRDLERSLMR